MKEFLISDYLAPVISIISTLATIVALFFTWYQIVDIKKDKITESLYDQSSKIAVWNYTKGTPDLTNIRISNNSSLPIYNVFIIMPLNVSTNLEADLKVLAEQSLYFHADVIPPEKTDVFVRNAGPASGQKIPVPCIFFTDSQNNEWFRDKKGKLIQYKDYEKYLVKLGVTYPLSN